MLARTLTLRDAVAIGLGSMVGAGLFVVWGPAAALAGPWLLVSLLIAALVAWCNAMSSAALAIRYPLAGGTYVYGRRQLGEFPGYLAGWCFVIGKTASCGAMALVIGAAISPDFARPLAVAAVIAVVALNLAGVKRSARYSEFVVVCVLLGLLIVAGGALFATGQAPLQVASAAPSATPWSVLSAAGLIFFAFAGYARIATLAEEVADPTRTLPRAIGWSLGLITALYLLVACALLIVLGPSGLADSSTALVDLASALIGTPGAVLLAVVSVLAATGALVNLMLGVSRTSLAMARDGYGPRSLTRTTAGGVPWVAEVLVGLVVIILVATIELRAAIGFSSFGVLLYYAIANASALTLREGPRYVRVVAVCGLLGCLILVFTLPARASLAGLVVVACGAGAYVLTRRLQRDLRT